MPNVPDYSQYVAVKKISAAQTANTRTSIVKARAPYSYSNPFPMYKSIRLPRNSLISNKFLTPLPIIFRPTDLANLGIWLDAGDASSVQLTSNKVTTWTDKSGNGKSATASTSYGPSYSSVNGNTSINFGGTTYLSLPNFTSVPMTVFMVSANYGAPVENTFFLYLGNNTLFFRVLYDTQGNPGDDTFGIDNGSVSYQSGVRDTNTHIWSFVLPASAYGTLLFDGNPSADTTGPTLGANTTFSGNTIGIYGPQLNGGINAGISEIIIYNSALSVSDRQLVEGYLAWKWKNVSRLPSTHPYKTTQVFN